MMTDRAWIRNHNQPTYVCRCVGLYPSVVFPYISEPNGSACDVIIVKFHGRISMLADMNLRGSVIAYMVTAYSTVIKLVCQRSQGFRTHSVRQPHYETCYSVTSSVLPTTHDTVYHAKLVILDLNPVYFFIRIFLRHFVPISQLSIGVQSRSSSQFFSQIVKDQKSACFCNSVQFVNFDNTIKGDQSLSN